VAAHTFSGKTSLDQSDAITETLGGTLHSQNDKHAKNDDIEMAIEEELTQLSGC